jgi:hypothetical protein
MQMFAEKIIWDTKFAKVVMVLYHFSQQFKNNIVGYTILLAILWIGMPRINEYKFDNQAT